MPFGLLAMGASALLGRRKRGRAAAPRRGGGVSFMRGGRAVRRRRRRSRLTQSELMELTQVKNILGKTAAANALPFYLGRGR